MTKGLKVRNHLITTLTEGDILINGELIQHVANGEINIYGDGTVNTDNGELAEISIDGIPQAIAAGKEVFNLSDIV